MIGVVGAGGHARVVLSALLQAGLKPQALRIFDDDPRKWETTVDGVLVVGGVDHAVEMGIQRG